MSLSQYLKRSRESSGISIEELSLRLNVPAALIRSIEEPDSIDDQAVELLAGALGITAQEFRGCKPRINTEERIAATIKLAKYPAIRSYLVDSSRCENPRAAVELFGQNSYTLAEKNLILYLSTTALYHFCDTNTSTFSFDSYLYILHSKLLKRFEAGLETTRLSVGQKQERMRDAQSNIFCCAPMEDIAIYVLEDFASELEQKILAKDFSFEPELSMPLSWFIDEELMRIFIRDKNKKLLYTLNLLDVAGKKQSA